MQHRTFKATGAEVSLLGFGAMRLPLTGQDKGDIDYATAKAMVDAAYAGGVNYYDTAWPYHEGQSEPFLAKALADKPRQSYFLASKLPIWLVEKSEDVMDFFNQQLQRCGTEYFDYYLVHALDAERVDKMEALGIWQILDEQKKLGKIRNLGFSFHDDPPVLEKLCGLHHWDFAQIQCNYLDWELQNARRQYEILEENGIPCVIMEPVRGGRLADLGPKANQVLKAAAPEKSIASWALRWVAGLPGVFTILSGMSSPQQVEDNLSTLGNYAPFTPEEEKALKEAVAIFKDYAIVPCTACRYCMPCPAGVDIPGTLAMYNECAFDGTAMQLQEKYAEFPKGQNAGNCIACGQCEAACPQHLAVSQLMETIHQKASAL